MKSKPNELNVKLIPYTRSTNKNRDNIKPYGVSMIQAKSMWDIAKRGKDIKIAVIDSGCDINHESLKDSIIGIRNFTDEDNKNPDIVKDRIGHGTHVVGTIVAKDNKKNNPIGVAPEAKIYVLKAIDSTGTGKISWIISAIQYAINKKVDIISMSLGTAKNDEKLERIIKEAIKKNILVVCAAGNEGNNNIEEYQYSYPAAYTDVISVGAVDKKGEPAEFSNSNLVIDVVAPGVDIISTYPDNSYASLSGTSMATPHVAGSLALIKNWAKSEFKRELTEEELYAQLIKHTKTLSYPRSIQGNGVVYLKIK